MQKQLFFAVLRGKHSRSKLFWTLFLFHSREADTDTDKHHFELFPLWLIEFGQTVCGPIPDAVGSMTKLHANFVWMRALTWHHPHASASLVAVGKGSMWQTTAHMVPFHPFLALSKRKITHLIGSQPASESYDVFWCIWAFSVEIAQGMSKNICNYWSTRKEKGRRQRKARTPPPPNKTSHIRKILAPIKK